MAKVNLKPAASGLNHHSYDVSTALTLDFGELVPTRIIETCLKDRFSKVSANGILRLAPQGFPAYGKAYVKNAAFFVPEHQLIEYSEALHSNMATWKGEAVVCPRILGSTLNYVFTSDFGLGLSTQVGSGVTDPSDPSAPALNTYDFIWLYDNSGSSLFKYYRLTTLGRSFYKILKSLGYDFSSYVNDPSYSVAHDSASYYVSCLPLLAYLKVYVDMFLNGTFYNNNELVEFLHHIRDHKDFSDSLNRVCYTASTGLVGYHAFRLIVSNLLLPHETDMYYDAWNQPNSPDGVTPNGNLQDANPVGLISPYFTDQTANFERNYANVKGNYLMHFTTPTGSSSLDLNYLSARGLRLLTAFDKFVRMAHLSGSKAVQRIYARFGIKPDDFNSHFVHKLYEGSSRIQFSPVMSNSDTENSSPSPYSGKGLGSYAGMGISGINMEFNYNPTDFGYIICVSWLQVVPFLTRGFHPQTLRLNSLDFYTPEYDGKTIRPIPQLEVAVNKNSKETSLGDKLVYGFTNLYDDYREMRDVIAGDFVTDEVAKNFLFARDLSYFRNLDISVQPQLNAVHYWDKSGNPDMTDVFQMSHSNGDRFYLYLDWNIEADRAIMSRADSFDLYGAGDNTVAINGNEIS